MEQIPTRQLEHLERLLLNESRIPLTNKLLNDESADKLNNTWLNKSWSSLLHSDLVEAGEQLHYRRVLKAACDVQLPALREDLEENEYQALIMDLVEQQYQELEEHGSVNALYLLEMACELSRFEGSRPAYMELLNMIKLHRLKYGTLERLRNEKPLGDRFQTRYLKDIYERGLNPNDGTFSGDPDEIRRFRNVANKIDAVTGFNCIEPEPETEGHVHDEVVRLWSKFEDHVISNISSLLNNSEYMRKIKKYLWKRQEQFETVFDETISASGDPKLVHEFKEVLILKRPKVRNGMGKKISAKPEIAEKIYTILDRLIAAEVPALKFLDVFEALADARFDGAVCEIQMDLEGDSSLATNTDRLMLLLNSFDSRYQDLSSREKNELARRQYSAFNQS